MPSGTTLGSGIPAASPETIRPRASPSLVAAVALEPAPPAVAPGPACAPPARPAALPAGAPAGLAGAAAAAVDVGGGTAALAAASPRLVPGRTAAVTPRQVLPAGSALAATAASASGVAVPPVTAGGSATRASSGRATETSGPAGSAVRCRWWMLAETDRDTCSRRRAALASSTWPTCSHARAITSSTLRRSTRLPSPAEDRAPGSRFSWSNQFWAGDWAATSPRPAALPAYSSGPTAGRPAGEPEAARAVSVAAAAISRTRLASTLTRSLSAGSGQGAWSGAPGAIRAPRKAASVLAVTGMPGPASPRSRGRVPKVGGTGTSCNCRASVSKSPPSPQVNSQCR